MKRKTVGLVLLVDRDHVRVVDRCRDPGLVQEALAEPLAPAQRRREDLQGDPPSQPRVLCLVHDTHRAAPQHGRDRVAGEAGSYAEVGAHCHREPPPLCATCAPRATPYGRSRARPARRLPPPRPYSSPSATATRRCLRVTSSAGEQRPQCDDPHADSAGGFPVEASCGWRRRRRALSAVREVRSRTARRLNPPRTRAMRARAAPPASSEAVNQYPSRCSHVLFLLFSKVRPGGRDNVASCLKEA